MNALRTLRNACLMVAVAAAPAVAGAQTATTQAPPAQGPYEPKIGQPGKDVVWVPSPESTVEKMLDVAKVTPQDFVVDLGSGDGRNVIAAAKRGARALGVEYNPDMVELSKRNAAKAGVGDKATFVQGDMYAAEFSQATVLALFLLPDNLLKLRDKFAALKPGTRIVANTFGIEDWTADETITIDGDCQSWCTVLLYVVPAQVDGTWDTPQGTLTLKQQFQVVSGSLGTASIENGRVKGDEVSFSVAGTPYKARVTGDTMTGTLMASAAETAWRATRAPR